MIKFDGEKTATLLQRKKQAHSVGYAVFALLIVSAVIAAALARGAYENSSNWNLYLAALILAIIFLVGLILVVAILIVPADKKLKFAVCKEIADGMLARKDMLAGSGVIEFAADYSGDVLTLSRKNFTGAISIDPARLKSAEGLGGAGAKIELDLKPLKAVPSLYAAAGSKLWLFLQAYYELHGTENGAESVTITDNMGKTPLTLQVFDNNAPRIKAAKNYFIDKGLVK